MHLGTIARAWVLEAGFVERVGCVDHAHVSRMSLQGGHETQANKPFTTGLSLIFFRYCQVRKALGLQYL